MTMDRSCRRASDIHFEPVETEFKIRYRVDGALYEMAPPPKQSSRPVAAVLRATPAEAGVTVASGRTRDGRRVAAPTGGVRAASSVGPGVGGVLVRVTVAETASVGLMSRVGVAVAPSAGSGAVGVPCTGGVKVTAAVAVAGVVAVALATGVLVAPGTRVGVFVGGVAGVFVGGVVGVFVAAGDVGVFVAPTLVGVLVTAWVGMGVAVTLAVGVGVSVNSEVGVTVGVGVFVASAGTVGVAVGVPWK